MKTEKEIKRRYAQRPNALLNVATLTHTSQTKLGKGLNDILKTTGIKYVVAGLALSPDATICSYASKEGDQFVIFHDGFNNRINDINDPFSKKSCMDLCISTTGQFKFDPSVKIRQRRTAKFYNWKKSKGTDGKRNPFNSFVLELQAEIEELKRKCLEDGFVLVIRLNTVSDIIWERMKWLNAANIFEYNKDVIWYDYTKIPIEKRNNRPSNYHLTFSHSGHFDRSAAALAAGVNVAVVFYCLRFDCPNCSTKAGGLKYSCKPSFLEIGKKLYKVIDGDKTDLRFKDESPVIVGLSYKTAHTQVINKNNKSGYGYVRIQPKNKTWINPKIKV